MTTRPLSVFEIDYDPCYGARYQQAEDEARLREDKRIALLMVERFFRRNANLRKPGYDAEYLRNALTDLLDEAFEETRR